MWERDNVLVRTLNIVKVGISNVVYGCTVRNMCTLKLVRYVIQGLAGPELPTLTIVRVGNCRRVNGEDCIENAQDMNEDFYNSQCLDLRLVITLKVQLTIVKAVIHVVGMRCE